MRAFESNVFAWLTSQQDSWKSPKPIRSREESARALTAAAQGSRLDPLSVTRNRRRARRSQAKLGPLGHCLAFSSL